MKIAIVVNKHLTMFMARLAPHLERAGHELFWISPSLRWSLWLQQESGIDPARILTLADREAEWAAPRADSTNALLDLEGPHRMTIASLIAMCRALRDVPAQTAYGYLATCRKYIEPFLKMNAIDVCIGEPTWGFELLIWMLCRRMGIPYLHPTTTRIPDDRFAFYDAIPHRIPEIRNVSGDDIKWAETFYGEWKKKPRRPIFSLTLPSPMKFRRSWWEELRISLMEPSLNKGDLTLWPTSRRATSRAATAINRLDLAIRSPFERPEHSTFVLLCLHQQPEASIDVVGAPHSDQRSFVERISRLLPASHELWVKEHIDSLGGRPRSWLRHIGKLPNVRLVDPRLSTFDLMRKASLVISVSGTVSYEAALLGVPAATAVPIFFAPLMAVDSTRYPDPITWPWAQLLGSPPSPSEIEARAIDFLSWIHAQSFPGWPYDPITALSSGRDPNDVRLEAASFIEAFALPRFPRASRNVEPAGI